MCVLNANIIRISNFSSNHISNANWQNFKRTENDTTPETYKYISFFYIMISRLKINQFPIECCKKNFHFPAFGGIKQIILRHYIVRPSEFYFRLSWPKINTKNKTKTSLTTDGPIIHDRVVSHHHHQSRDQHNSWGSFYISIIIGY